MCVTHHLASLLGAVDNVWQCYRKEIISLSIFGLAALE